MVCPNCSKETADAFKFCPNCGAEVDKPSIKVDQDVGTVKGSVSGIQLAKDTAAKGINASTEQKVDTVEDGGAVVGSIVGAEQGHIHVGGEQQYGDMVQGDQVGGDKITNYVQLLAPEAPPLTPENRANIEKKQILLQRVNDFWVRDVLKHSTQNNKLIKLQEKVEHWAIEKPWEQNYPAQDEAAQSNLKIYDIFVQSHRALLILGQPGSGKTTTLITLARDLVSAAEKDPLQPIPVILTLVSWENSRQKLSDWIVRELKTKYQIPSKLGRKWLKNDDLILLLDGLDELSSKHRQDCALAINQFREEYGLTGIVVTSRKIEYVRLSEKLTLDLAIGLQPLSSAQIDAFLDNYGPNTMSLRHAIREDATLNQFAHSPLMLNVLCTAYVDRDDLPHRLAETDTWSGQARLPLREQLFETYFSRVFDQQTSKPEFSQEITKKRLGWLAVQMKNDNQAIFQIDHIQPSWLQTRISRVGYLLLTRSFWGLVLGLFMWSFILAFDIGPLVILINVIIGLALGVFQAVSYEVDYSRTEQKPLKPRGSWKHALILGSITAVVITGGVQFLNPSAGEGIPFLSALYVGLINASASAIAAYFSFGSNYRDDIQTAESLSWSSTGALKWAFPGLIFGLVLGFLGGATLDFPLRQQLLLGLESALLWSLNGGLRARRLDSHVIRNQATRIALRNSMIAGLLVGLAYGALIAVLWGLPLGIIRALQFTLGAGFMYGGFDLLKYILLRALLWASGHITATFTHFLDFAVDLNLLNRVGGGFMFMHRILLDYFANIGIDTSR